MSNPTQKTVLLNAVAQSNIDMANFSFVNLGGTVGLGTVTSVGLAVPNFLTISGTNPIVGSGTLTLTLANQNANTFFGNFTGGSAAPTFGTAAQALTSLGAISGTSPTITDATINQAANGDTAITSKRFTDTSPTGNFEKFIKSDNTVLWNVDISGTLATGMIPVARVTGLAASATTDATNASNINQGTLAKTYLPATAVFTDQANTFGAFAQKLQANNLYIADQTDATKLVNFDASNIVTGTTRKVTIGNADSAISQPYSAISHQFLTSMSATGAFTGAQPAFTDISGVAAAAQLPNPSASTLGGVQSLASVASKWINTISTSGVPSATQPAFSDISGTLAIGSGGTGQITATAATNALLPSQGSNSGKFLSTDGANTSWVTVAGGGTFSNFSFVNTNGFVGTVANATTAPALTLKLGDSTDNTKTATFDVSNVTTGTNRVITVPNAASTVVVSDTGASNNFLTAISTTGAISKAQPSVSNLSDTKTGSGNLVLATSPTLTTPTIGAAVATSITGLTAATTPNAAAGTDIGSAALPFANFYVGTAATNCNKVTSSATTATRTFTLPDANSNSVIPDTGASNNFLTAISSGGVISKAQPAFSNLSGSVANAQMPALTGDVTTSAGAVATTLGTISKNFTLSGIVSPSQITADQNDYNPTGWSTGNYLRLSTDATRNVTGLAGGADGRFGIIHNVGSNNVVLISQSSSSSAANRFALNHDQIVRPDDMIDLVYDNTSARWRLSTTQSKDAADITSGSLAAVRGGTGVSNSSTITLGGAVSTANSLTTSGNFALTLTTTATTNSTLPAGTTTLVPTSGATFTGEVIASASTGPTDVASVGFRGIPQQSKSAAYTTVLADAGKHILHPSSDNNARTFTIDSNANVAYPIGTTITFINMINTVTIAIATDTMTLLTAGTTGSRTLAVNGIATAIKIGTTSWVISGQGLT